MRRNTERNRRTSLATLLALVGLVGLAPGQALAAGSTRVAIDYVDVTKAPEFRVYVDYLDAAGRPIPQLDLRDLQMVIDGEPYGDEIGITPFKKSEERSAFVLLVNNSLLYSDVFEEQKKGLVEFVRGLRAKDMATVIYYNEQVVPVGDGFTSDKEELTQAINSIPTPDKPKEAFVDAVIAGLDRFPDADPSFPRSRGLVMFADGLDQGLSDKSALMNRIKKDLAPKAKAMGVKFWGIGYTIESNEGLSLMSALTKSMGGNFTEIKSNQLNTLGTQFTRILDAVYGQYILSFVTDDLETEPHTIQVNINYKGTPAESTPVEFQPPPVPGTPWWVLLLIIVGGLVVVGGIVGLVVMIVRRKRNAPEEEEDEPERECPVCGEGMDADERTCQVCMKTPHKAELKKVGGEWDGFIYIITEEITTIGSREGDILIADSTVSGKHAGIKVDEMKFELADFGSTNGTYVNGKKVTKQFLKDGDVIKLGQVDLKFNLS